MKEIKTFVHFAKPYRLWIILATLCMVVVTGMSLAGPWVIRSLTATIENGVNDVGTLAENTERVKILSVLVIGIYIMRALTRFGTNYISHYAAWKILEDIRSHIYNHFQKLSLRFFQDKQTGDLMSRVINDTRNFEVLLAHAIPTIVVNVIMFSGVTAILFTMNTELALYTLIPIPLLAWMVLKFSKISRPRFKKAQEEVAVLNSTLQDNFTGMKEIKAFTQEEQESKRTSKAVSGFTNAILRALKLSNAFHPGIELVSSIGTVIVIFFGGVMALNNNLGLPDLVAFLFYLQLLYQPITSLGQINEGIQQALASAERVVEVLDEEPEIKEPKHAKKLTNVKGAIEFKNVSFQYVKNIPVLNHISFKLKAGHTLALVGATGVGKTTIASLIPRFFDPTEGEIYIDHTDMRQLTLKSLRQQISIVSQDVFLFNGTVRENILYGRSGASDNDVISAAKAANAHDFILSLEHGYETKVGERGVKLSGGQKQRISIARAILKDAPILILDEATSAVDTETERLIQNAINKLKQDKTTIVIAHRLSTVQDADQILVLKEGKIVEQGKHVDLLAFDGLYKKLCRAQSTETYIAV
ncbi:ABC transporter ATP-binding protein [Haloplasma contractile]|uniref:ATP-binding cassette subfamily B bacterial MsbA protein n=1 Tax=Haloplasma contractile SSD-17B TaxID=1033810 RepID=U2EBH5_9MOLU|nr:ABC transporter ATP-binding protein [Haloplasma contractile]ERJ12146.1 ATP-binding cassette subfamily B bacterial MsbA protein [Haloplasma contractile SSD-17B]